MANLRRLVKTAAAEATCLSGADRLLAALPAPAGGALVLGYHRVAEDCARRAAGSIPAMLISVAVLEAQLEWVGRRFRFVSLDELGRQLESGAPTGRPPAAVTFDDGYRDVYEHAFPLLTRKGIPAAVFVVTDFVGTSRLLRHDRLYLLLARALAQPPSARAELGHLLRRLGLHVPVFDGTGSGAPRAPFPAMRALLEAVPPAGLDQLMQALDQAMGPVEDQYAELRALDWDMVRALHRAGFTIGSHTCSHALLTSEGRDRVQQQLAASRRRLEHELGAPVRHFAYPDGRFNGAVVDEVAAAGYRFAYTTCRHRDRGHPLLTVPRRLLWENSCQDVAGRFSPAVMRCQVEGVFDLMSRCRLDHRSASRGGLQPMSA